MSVNLFYERYKPQVKKDTSMCTKLKRIIALYLEEEHSLAMGRTLLTNADQTFLAGVLAGTEDKELIKDVQRLLNFIIIDGGVWVYIE